MKQYLLFLAISFSANIFGQSICDNYRKIMNENMNSLDLDEFSRQFIVGKNGEYYNLGMSQHFISEPKVPDFGKLNSQRNPHIVSIEIAHVNLYHYDVEELKGRVLKSENHVDELIQKLESKTQTNNFVLFPNPTNGQMSIDGPQSYA